MTAAANKELVRRHIELSWHEASFDSLDDIWAADAIVHLWDGRTLTGLAALKAHLRTAVLPWSDRLVTCEDLVAEGETVANRWSFRGVIPPGPQLVMTGMDFYRCSDGKIVEEWIEVGPPAESVS